MQPGDVLSKAIDAEEAVRAQAAADAAVDMPAERIDPRTFYIDQRWERYSPAEHATWRTLYDRRIETLRQQASNVFLTGFDAFNLPREHVPRLTQVNDVLRPRTGWQSRAVPGYLPAKAFFACLARREFPTTISIRPADKLDYLPEPDIFHDVYGHVPLHADATFADFLQTYGRAALLCEDPEHVKRLGRLFWFTVEFGLVREDGRLKIYGSGLMSSIGESAYAMESDIPERRPFDLERVCETDFEIDKFQPIYYVLESFEQLRDAMTGYAEQVLGTPVATGR